MKVKKEYRLGSRLSAGQEESVRGAKNKQTGRWNGRKVKSALSLMSSILERIYG